MDKNLFYDQQLFTLNSSQPVSTHSYNSFNTNESQNFSTDVTGDMTDISDTSYDFTTFNTTEHTLQNQQILQTMTFYHFSSVDNNFYYVTCKIVLCDDFDDHDHYNHKFFFQHPDYPSTIYFVTCKLLSFPLIENLLNNGMDFDVNCKVLLSLHQKFNLEQSLKQKLFNLMYCNRNANSTTQTNSMTNYDSQQF
ncbi:hypothetical protein C1645_812164 [Glomus cerebriforme]|uniref:Uncharacterized protein n=1 Tax=Glomus cerebriforme TaxID=658196 RepID=A0A397TN47_9GLOM|nr:hypothetical protein C1645_812164 [Glomus cerebriforme]